MFNDGDANAAAAVVAVDATIHTDELRYVGPEGLVDYLSFLERSYPDAEFDVTSIEVRGDTVEVRWAMSATYMIVDNREPAGDMDPTRSGVVTLTVTEAQVASLTLTTDARQHAS